MNLDLANTVPGKPTYVNGKLNINAFQANDAGPYGNQQRNSFRATPFVHVDPAFFKAFPLYTDRLHLLLRAEAFNVLNHPNLTPVASDLNTLSSFGITQIARYPRILQLSGKIQF